MKVLFAIAFLFQLSIQVRSQSKSLLFKTSLDTSVLGKWPALSGGALSPNGKYLCYVLEEHMPVDQITTVIQSPDGKWKKELKGVAGVQFSADSRSAIYLRNDTLEIIKLGNTQVIKVIGVQSFKLVPYSKGEWLVYQLKAPHKALIIQDEKTKKESRFQSVEGYFFSKGGETVVLESKSEGGKENQLRWVGLLEGKEITFWKGPFKPQQLIFDEGEKQLVFSAEENGKHSIWHWYYNRRGDSAEMIVKDGDLSIEKGLFIGSLDRFSKDGERVFFNLERRYEIPKLNPDAANVNVWRYNDLKLQSEQWNELYVRKRNKISYLSVLHVAPHKVFRILRDNDHLKVYKRGEQYTIIYQLDTDQDVGIGSEDWGWQPAVKNGSYYLVSNKDGSRKQLPFRSIYGPQLSPNEKFIIYRPLSTLNYLTYEIVTGTIRNITSSIKTDLTHNECYKNVPIEKQLLITLPGWLRDDSAVFIYDRNDIWLVDPLAKRAPECITNGYGLRYGLIFRLGLNEYRNQPFKIGQKLVLTAFSKRTKQNGHYLKVVGEKGDPKIINMEMPLYAVGISSGSNGGDCYPAYPEKAKGGDAYLLKKQTISDYPNYYYTKDLKHFHQITFLVPEKKFNWITSELHSWVAPDGDTLQGVLYKPENFDSSRKYPVLFSIYRQFSDELNWYQFPNWTTDRIDIPWFVSQGYLVFTPDIHYTIPNIKESVLNCVVSAAKYIGKLSFVDSTKLGIQGHSFGGLEIGYVVTGTDVFAAGCSTAGSYDLISDDGSILPTGDSRQGIVGNHMLFETIWENKNLYIENSALFEADQAKFPLLMVAGVKDNVKPYDQNVEFFLALRRLSKPVWMLTYEDEGHGIVNKKADFVDYTIRLTQFYNHFLKSAMAPIWMTKGIPARLKGLEQGYELDYKVNDTSVRK